MFPALIALLTSGVSSALRVLTLRDAAEATNPYGPAFFHILVLCSPAAVATIVVTEQSITVTGLAVGDIIVGCNKPTINGAIGLLAGRAAANAWLATFVNPTAGSITPTAGEVYKLLVYRPAQ